MEKKQPTAQPQAKPQPRQEGDILGIMDLETVLRHAAEGKAQIARGESYTIDEVMVRLEQKRKKLLSEKN